METTTLYRPVGQVELELIAEAGWTAFPPRLPEQPIFYPVLTRSYAEQIARDWNTKDPANGSVGYVTRFLADAARVRRYPAQQVGDIEHIELWVPADELPEFNRRLIGPIEILAAYVNLDGTPTTHPGLTRRLIARVIRDFGTSGGRARGCIATARLHDGRLWDERIATAAVLFGDGALVRLTSSCDLAAEDFRDVLVRGDLETEAWPEQLDRELGPVPDGDGPPRA